MITIIVNNSYSRIEGLKTDEFRALRKLLSYTTDPKAAYFSRGFSSPKYLIDKTGQFPTGLLEIAKKYVFRTFSTPAIIKDNRVRPRYTIPFILNTAQTPYEAQLKAADLAALHNRGGIVMPTGTGKSFVIALIIARLGVKTLVVVPSLEIKKQLTTDLIERLGPTPFIRVENIDSTALKDLTDFDCLIIDECHHVAAKTYQKLNKTAWTKIYYRFFLTATFFRNQENEHLLFEGIAGQEIYRLSQKEATDKGYIVPIEAYYVDLPKQSVEGYSWREVYSETVINNHYRNGTIAGMLDGLQAQDKFCLCLVKEIAHGNILSELSGVPFANGKDETSREYIKQFNEGKIRQLIGTTGILAEGVDTKPCEYVIIAGLGKAKSAFMQAIGRSVRRYPGKESAKVIIFKDRSHKFSLRHFNEQKKILLTEYGINVLKLT